MIKKLSEYKITSRDGSFINVECNTKIINTLVQKINELVDAVNELEKNAENRENPKVEQHKWIGCICRFWYDDPNNTLLDYLNKIQTGKNGVEYYAKESGDWFPNCEPVLPTDNAIYKGGDNE